MREHLPGGAPAQKNLSDGDLTQPAEQRFVDARRSDP
jgi:hypothetical protein